MKTIKSIFVILVFPIFAFSQEKDFIEKYFSAIKPNIKLNQVNEDTLSFNGLLRKFTQSGPCMIYKKLEDNNYIGILNDFFEYETETENENKQLILILIKERRVLLFMNSLHDLKSKSDIINSDELFMRDSSVTSLIFDFDYNYKGTIRIFPISANVQNKVEIAKIIGTSYYDDVCNTRCELYSHILFNENMQSFANNMKCFLNSDNYLRRSNKRVSVINPNNNFFIGQWKRRGLER